MSQQSSEPEYPFAPASFPKKKRKEENNKKTPMKNITINIPEIYDENIWKLIKLKLFPSRSEAIRTALREFLVKEYKNLELLGFFEESGEKNGN